MWAVKAELEDLCFAVLQVGPSELSEISSGVVTIDSNVWWLLSLNCRMGYFAVCGDVFVLGLRFSQQALFVMVLVETAENLSTSEGGASFNLESGQGLAVSEANHQTSQEESSTLWGPVR